VRWPFQEEEETSLLVAPTDEYKIEDKKRDEQL